MLMMAESGEPGAWWRVFNQPLTAVHAEPALRDVDYPHPGVRRARNDMDRRVLEVSTSAATPSRRRTPTTVTSTGYPAAPPSRSASTAATIPTGVAPARTASSSTSTSTTISCWCASDPLERTSLMTTALADVAHQLSQLLDLTHPPVAISFARTRRTRATPPSRPSPPDAASGSQRRARR